MLQPLLLSANQPRQFYRGGEAIAAFRRVRLIDAFRPEDWVASTTSRFGQSPTGLSQVEDGEFLRELVEAAPEKWLGPEHVASFGQSTALLVKLLDAGQRLPVHFHPPRTFAYRHLGSLHGKTEAWVVLGTRGAEPAVYLGWANDVSPEQLGRWAEGGSTEPILGAMNKLAVRPGEGFLVPAGTAHAIGEGVFSLEVQEPTDFSIMLELEGFGVTPGSAYLGLDRDLALSCVERRALTAAELEALRQRAEPKGGLPPVSDALPVTARPYFRVERLLAGARLPASFAVVVCVSGSCSLIGEHWEMPLSSGDTVLVPWEAGAVSLAGEQTGSEPIELLRCLPPLPSEFAADDPRHH